MQDNRLKLMEAIARRKVVATQYNGLDVKLAPHLLFERHGDLFVSALNLSKARRADEVPRLGHYKLAGLGAAEVLDEPFAPLPSLVLAAPRSDDTLLITV